MIAAEPMVKRLARVVPRPLLWPARLLVFSLAHRGYDQSLRTDVDSTAYWRGRAGVPAEGAVMWSNPDYMRLFRDRQRAIIGRHLAALPAGGRVLDVGCGIGTVTRMMHELRPDLRIDGVDLPEMVATARSFGEGDGVAYIGALAEDYLAGEGVYDLVLSSSSYAVMRDPARLRRALGHGFKMAKRSGTVLMIEPFQTWNYLARGRAKLAPAGVERIAGEAGFRLAERGDLLFWPFRDWYSNSAARGEAMRRRFELGERLLRLLGPGAWSDYKVLVFKAA